MDNKKIFTIILLIYSSLILSYVLYLKDPMVTGDGKEYLSMTISLYNHFTPDLREEDIELRKNVELKNRISTQKDRFYSGYFESLEGKYYSYHFWVYSLVNLPVFSVLHYFNLNELRSFQITNSLLVIFSLITILYFYKDRGKTWFLLLSAVNPVLLYVAWTHPEVFIYSFIVVSLVFWSDKRYLLAAICSSVASLQSAPIAIFTIYLLILYLSSVKTDIKKIIGSLMPLLITVTPYFFYYANYGKFSLIAGGAAKVDYISIDKALSIFFDANFGIMTYMPITLILATIVVIYDMKNKRLATLTVLIIILLISILYSTQGNWNAGMMYINRYSVAIIPFLVLTSLRIFEEKPKINTVCIIISLISVVIIIGGLLYEYDYSNHRKFNNLSKEIFINFPSMYNPDPEIFAERSLGGEVSYSDNLPIVYLYDNKPRKILYKNSRDMDDLRYIFNFSIGDDIVHTDKNLYYVNYPSMFEIPDFNKTTTLYRSKNDPDIIQNVTTGKHFIRRSVDRVDNIFIKEGMTIQIGGFYGVGSWGKDLPARWMANSAYMIIYPKTNNISSVSFGIRSFDHMRILQVYSNNKLVYEQNVSTSYTEVKIPVETDKRMVLGFYIPEGCQIPKTNDTRCLSVSLMNIKIS